MRYLFGIYSALLLIFPLCSHAQETLTITTYYPAPFGVYQELRARRIALGDNYINNTFCWPGEACANHFDANEDLVVEGNVAIGNTNTHSNLAVNNSITFVPTTAPSSADEGTLYYNSTQRRFYYHDNNSWELFSGGYSQRMKVTTVGCEWGGTYTLDADCPDGWTLIGCAGGPGDQDQNCEVYYIDPLLAENRCRGHFKEPHCGGSEAERRQRVIAICAR